MKSRDLAVIEVANQAIFLRSFHFETEATSIILVTRPRYPVAENKIKDYLLPLSVSTKSVLSVLIILLTSVIKYDRIILGSHLGLSNKCFIIAATILYKKVIVLDDGIFSVRKPQWLLRLGYTFKNLIWYSYYYRDTKCKFIYNYCLIKQPVEREYRNTAIFAMSDFAGLGLSVPEEEKILRYVQGLALKENLDLVLLPHRRGRRDLYNALGLTTLIHDRLCFEDWYLTSEFINCCIIGSFSSIWQILEDHRVKTLQLDFGYPNMNLDLINVEPDQLIEVREITNE